MCFVPEIAGDCHLFAKKVSMKRKTGTRAKAALAKKAKKAAEAEPVVNENVSSPEPADSEKVKVHVLFCRG
ncbi:unnamed protein product [Allacma fusca]|uniref:Uncharacterized protein n=1 Tax=Allacma fusca TaxID=39272 RepID=A0A8J2LJD5_9HEXA|nr:unnamed protein product [Allacma fusca]CAG7834189.1 unnamed protein product [Allacma fusca]